MSEKRFIALGSRYIKDTLTGEEFYAPSEEELLDLLNEQQATNSALRTENNHLIDVIKEYAKKYEEQQSTITELERKLNKYAKIGEEQLKQIIDLQDELNECRARPTLATDERGVVKVEYR